MDAQWMLRSGGLQVLVMEGLCVIYAVEEAVPRVRRRGAPKVHGVMYASAALYEQTNASETVMAVPCTTSNLSI